MTVAGLSAEAYNPFLMTPRTLLVTVSLALSVAIGSLLHLSHRRPDASPAAVAADGVLIGLSMDTLKEERWQHDRNHFVNRARELGAEVLVQSANGDDAEQIQNVASLLSRKVDVLVIIPHDGAAMARAVAMAREAGVPVIAYDRIIGGEGPDLYITFDNIRVGELQAQFVADQLKDKWKARVVRILGSKTDHNAFLFKQGQDNILDPLVEKNRIQIIHEDWAQDWKPENAKKIMNAALSSKGKTIHAVLASNDSTAGGAVQALLEEGLAGKLPVTGQDAELAACQRILAGTQAMTVYKPIRQLATAAADTAIRLALRRPVVVARTVHNGEVDVPTILVPVQIVTRDNLEATVVADGFHAREALLAAPDAPPAPTTPSEQQPAPAAAETTTAPAPPAPTPALPSPATPTEAPAGPPARATAEAAPEAPAPERPPAPATPSKPPESGRSTKPDQIRFGR